MAAVKMFNYLEVTVTGSADEEAHPHGLGVVPEFVILTHGTHDEVTKGATAPDATNIYLDNANVADQAAKVIVFTPHSLISD